MLHTDALFSICSSLRELGNQQAVNLCIPKQSYKIVEIYHVKCLMTLLFLPPEFVGWSGGAMVLGNLPVPGRPTILITVGQGPIVLAVGAGRGGLDILTLIYPFSSFSLSLGDGPI